MSAVGCHNGAVLPNGLDLDLNLSTKVYDDDEDCSSKKKGSKPVAYSYSHASIPVVELPKFLSLSQISSSSSTQRNIIHDDGRRSMNAYVLSKKPGILHHQLVIKSSPISPQFVRTIIPKEQQRTQSTRLGLTGHNMVIFPSVFKQLPDKEDNPCDVEKATSPNKPPSCLQYSPAKNFSKKRAASSVGEERARSGVSERKKLRLTEEQSDVLEQVFMKHCTVDNKKKIVLAEQLNLKPRQVEVWFQNRRARTKLKQTEAHYEYLKGYCEELMKENQNLNKEIQRLRRSVAKFPHTPSEQQLCIPVADFTFVCPSCEKHLVPSSASDVPTSSSAVTSTHASPSSTPSLTIV